MGVTALEVAPARKKSRPSAARVMRITRAGRRSRGLQPRVNRRRSRASLAPAACPRSARHNGCAMSPFSARGLRATGSPSVSPSAPGLRRRRTEVRLPAHPPAEGYARRGPLALPRRARKANPTHRSRQALSCHLPGHMLESKNMAQNLEARVQNGRLVLDAPTDLPEGTVVPLQALEDDGGAPQSQEIDADLELSLQDEEAGRFVPFDEVITSLGR